MPTSPPVRNDDRRPARPVPDDAARTYHHGDLGNVLIELALAQIEESGSVELTVRGLARAAGVSHVAAYRHFADKTALLARIAELGFVELTRALAAASRTPDPVEAFGQQGSTYVRFALEHPGHFRVMWHRTLADRSAFGPLLAASQAAYGCIREGVTRLQEAGLTRPGHDVDDLTTFAWAGVHGIAGLMLEGVVAGGDEAVRRRTAARVADLITAAVLA